MISSTIPLSRTQLTEEARDNITKIQREISYLYNMT